MIIRKLNGIWEMKDSDGMSVSGTIPGSVYSFLLNAGEMEDPYYRKNELSALRRMDRDYSFTRTFEADGELLSCAAVYLRCEGLDTLCNVYLNDIPVGEADNFHRTYEWEVRSLLQEGENTLRICFRSPTRAIREADRARHVGGTEDAMRGFPHLRKPHCMFGWDWGPRLPDMGIFRDISLQGVQQGRIRDVHIRQTHRDGSVWLSAHTKTEGKGTPVIRLNGPQGFRMELQPDTETRIPEPQLWWPNGYGAQNLYTVEVALRTENTLEDMVCRRIGLRTVEVCREKDEIGESFAFRVNGVAIFAMGADYIPEDNVLSRMNPARTRKLLENCRLANFNCIRVWGGGMYPGDDFFDACDELGLLVWQDMMFACAHYPLDDAFEESITREAVDNIRRIRHHACLGLWCGNNEMESFERRGDWEGGPAARAAYIRIFEHILPHVLRREDPDTFYWPSSPSSGGSFDDPDDPYRGDVHYWDVWHGEKPFADYRRHVFRFVSEFGFQSFPGIKTVSAFTEPEDRNIFSEVMEMHQRNRSANGKIMRYLSDTYLYPQHFEVLLYASQMLQATAIRYGVEHWRRHRGECMGAIYWQLNDIWPVASWSSIDYYGRWKALHYAARRFFAPVMISCEEVSDASEGKSIVREPEANVSTARLCVANETGETVTGTVRWWLSDAASRTLQEGESVLSVPARGTAWLPKMDFSDTDIRRNHLGFSFAVEGQVISSGSVLFTAPKYYAYEDPKLSWSIGDGCIRVTAAAYAAGVEIENEDADLVLEDNYFDMEAGTRCVRILSGVPGRLRLRSVYDIR